MKKLIAEMRSSLYRRRPETQNGTNKRTREVTHV